MSSANECCARRPRSCYVGESAVAFGTGQRHVALTVGARRTRSVRAASYPEGSSGDPLRRPGSLQRDDRRPLMGRLLATERYRKETNSTVFVVAADGSPPPHQDGRCSAGQVAYGVPQPERAGDPSRSQAGLDCTCATVVASRTLLNARWAAASQSRSAIASGSRSDLIEAPLRYLVSPLEWAKLSRPTIRWTAAF